MRPGLFRARIDGSRRGEEGYFLVLALILTAAVMVMASGLAMLSTAALRATRTSTERAKALYAAESGLNRALYLLHTTQVTPSELKETVGTDSYRVWLGSSQQQCASWADTLVADGTSGGTTRRFSVDVVSIGFPKGTVEVKNDCPPGYQAPSIVLEDPPPDSSGELNSCPEPVSGTINICGEGPKNILVDGLTLQGTVNIDVDGPVNIYVKGDLSLAPREKGGSGYLRLNVSPRSRVTFYVYGDVFIGGKGTGDSDEDGDDSDEEADESDEEAEDSGEHVYRADKEVHGSNGKKRETDEKEDRGGPVKDEGSSQSGSRVDVVTNGWVVFVVQEGLTVPKDAVIQVSPAVGTQGPEGAVVFLVSTDHQKPKLKLKGASMELALYAPTRKVQLTPANGNGRPAVFGSVVAYKLVPPGQDEDEDEDENRYKDGHEDAGKNEDEHRNGHEQPSDPVQYNDRLKDFRHGAFGETSAWVRGSWREERIGL